VVWIYAFAEFVHDGREACDSRLTVAVTMDMIGGLQAATGGSHGGTSGRRTTFGP